MSARSRPTRSSVQPWKVVPITGNGVHRQEPLSPVGCRCRRAWSAVVSGQARSECSPADRGGDEDVERPVDRHPVDPRKHRLRPAADAIERAAITPRAELSASHFATRKLLSPVTELPQGFRRRDRPWRARLTTARRKHAVRGRGRTGETGRFPVLSAPGGVEPPHAASKAAALSAELRGPGGDRGVTDGTRTHNHRDHNPGLYQLSYGHRGGDSLAAAVLHPNAPGRIRTPDPRLRRPPLCPLSYRRARQG